MQTKAEAVGEAEPVIVNVDEGGLRTS